MSYQDDSSATIPTQSHFMSANGTAVPDGVTDMTERISHNGFVGIAQAIDPISPLTFGDPVRNDIIRMFGNTNPSDHQFYGFGVNGNTTRYQVNSTAGVHRFYGAISPTASKEYGSIADRKLTLGDPAEPIGIGHFTQGTIGDDGYLQYRSPNAVTSPNKVQAEVYFDAYSGNPGAVGQQISGSMMMFRTASTQIANSPLLDRSMINGDGDHLFSKQSDVYTASNAGTGALALMTVNGAIRVASGPIGIGNNRQSAGIVWGAGATFGGYQVGAETDGGITSIADNNTTFYNNGVITGRVDGLLWSKAGGGLWAALSDIRTKRDVKPHTPSVSVLKLTPIEFYYNGQAGTLDDGTRYVGFSAQDLLETGYAHWVTPSLMALDGEVWNEETHTPEERAYQVDSSNLIYELLGVIKTLAARVDALEGGGGAKRAAKNK
jgi:hypothetical protein